ncbi:helix-turn-helix domain-containing protein [Aquimarina spongiae]|uniref:AraC-type DNA-binding protein n=1 Tax=Aquimarina spongiae TaxID=570521 RepID=A0A1M6FIZ2_9FLAO|nr:helix-turn-helix domain-containing protein [Aquimarina spongiae]SHI97582.1 AraC-type DNA-binding protein [Aquimarina spongiae]
MRFVLCFITFLFINSHFIFSSGIDSLVIDAILPLQTNDSVQNNWQGKTYTELSQAYDNNRYKNSFRAFTIAKQYLQKAKQDLDTIKLADAYYMLLRLNWEQPKVALSYCDTIINLTKNTGHKYYPARAYIGKGIVSTDLKKNNDALEFYLLALQYAENSNNLDHIVACKHNIAMLKSTLGKYQEALSTFQKNLKIIKHRDTVNQFLDHYIATYYNLGNCYNRLGVLDSAQYYFKKGIIKSFSEDSKKYYPELLFGSGVNNFLRENYPSAIDSLKKASGLIDPILNNDLFFLNQLYIAKTHSKLNQHQKAFAILKKIDDSIDESNYSSSIKDAFTMLIDHYKGEEDQESQLKMMEKLIRYEQISQKREKVLSNNIAKNYDTAQLIKDKDELILGIQNRSKKLQYRFLLIAILVIATVSFAYFYYFKKEKKVYEQKIEEKYTDLIKKSSKRTRSSKQIEIAPEIVENIIHRLTKFEENQEFLKNDLTMANVAKKFKTNSSYLSKVINTHKKQNFANYLNDLRIEFCIQRLKTDQKFRRYSIKSIALETGFNNIQSFSAAFQKRIGQNPSDYIQNLNDQ